MCQSQKPSIVIRTVLALAGFSAVMGQIVLMREFIVVFNGNEISLGIVLATWLFWTAVGGSLGGGFRGGGSKVRRVVAGLGCLLGLSLPPTIWALRCSKSLFQKVPGELVGPVPMLLASLACLSVFCVVSGALFVAAARMYETECGISARIAVSSAYLYEAAGSALGGMVASMVLLRSFESFQIATFVVLLNLGMAAMLCFRMSRKLVGVLAVAAVLAAIPLLLFVAPRIDKAAQARLWQGFKLLDWRDSIYGSLAVTETGNMRSIYDNGLLLANEPDASAAEEAVHYALLEHAAPGTVLLIGGGANGSIAEALKHPSVGRIDSVELDPAIISVAQEFFSRAISCSEFRSQGTYSLHRRRALSEDGGRQV